MNLSLQEMERWQRQIALPEFGIEGQKRLKSSTVVIFGVGGVGSATALYLAGVGVGKLSIVDRDVVSLSNLHRQLIYQNQDIGQAKARVAGARLLAIDPSINIDIVDKSVDLSDIRRIVQGSNLVIDAFDKIDSRLAVNQACVEERLAVIHGFAQEFSGEACLVEPGKTPCLECVLDRSTYEPEATPILNISAGIIGIHLANMAIKYLTGYGELLAGYRYFWDFYFDQFLTLPLLRNPDCVICKHV